MPKIIHNGVEYGGGGYSKKQIDDKLRLKLDKSSVDAVLSSDSVKPVQNKVVTKALIDKVSQVKVMPTSDFDGVAVLYTGDTTTEYTQGHVYQYSETDSSWIDITDVLDVIKNIESLPTANIEDVFYRIGGGEWVTKTVTLSPDPDDTIEQLEAIGYTVLSDHYQESTNTRDVSFKGDNNHFGYVSHSNLYRIKTINATWSLSSGRYAVDGTGNDGHVSIVVLGSERKEDANFRVLAQNELWAGDSETQTIRRVAWNDEVTIQYEIMPTPSENELGKIVQYVGKTTGSYIKGFFYRCAEVPDTDPAQYEWVHQNVDEISGDAVVWVTDFPTAPDIKNVVYGKITTTTEYTNEKTVGLDSLDTETRITLDGDNYIPASTDNVYVKGGDVSDYEVFVSFNTVTSELTTSEGTYTLETETELTFATQTTTETKSFRIGNEERQELTELESGGTEVIANPSETATETLSKVNIDGTVYEVGGDTIQVETLPTAGASEVGNIYQYIGATTATLTNGYFYECVEDSGSYSWVEKEVQKNEDVPHWSGTRAEYEAIKDTLEIGTIVNITDDYDDGFEVVDVIENGNMNPVTSNAVAKMCKCVSVGSLPDKVIPTTGTVITQLTLPKGKWMVFGQLHTNGFSTANQLLTLSISVNGSAAAGETVDQKVQVPGYWVFVHGMLYFEPTTEVTVKLVAVATEQITGVVKAHMIAIPVA